MPAILRTLLRRLLRDECGQSLIVTISSMTVLVGVAAFGIDTASWMVKHHDAQIVADSAAMAAAHCLANPGKASSMMINGVLTVMPACTSGTDTADAQTVAVDYAAANGFSITPSAVNVNTTSEVVTVNASTHTPGVFSKVFGVSTTQQAAVAGAAYAASSGSCTSPGAGCDFMFADNSDCSSSANGINLSMSGNSNVSGVIQTNGNISGNTSGNPSLGTATYGPNGTSTCSDSLTYSGHDPWSTQPTQASTDLPYPIDYTQDFPACGGSADPCQTSGYPSFCTNEGSSITLNGSGNGDSAITNNVYCAVGTGNPAQPSTWNGSINVSLSGNHTLYDTFVGGSISFNGSGQDTLSSCGYTATGYASGDCNSAVPTPAGTNSINYPIFYATGTSSTALSISISGGQTLFGDMFAPNGTAALNMSGNKTLTTFIEANNISASISGTFQGDGPSTSGSGGSTGGTVSLVQ